MPLQHVDVAVVLPVTIESAPDALRGWHPGRLPTTAHHHGEAKAEQRPLEWNPLDRRLAYWLHPDTPGRRWHRRPGTYIDTTGADMALRAELSEAHHVSFDGYRDEEITLATDVGEITVALDGVDLVRLHDGDGRNAIAVLRFLLFLTPEMRDADTEPTHLATLAAALREFSNASTADRNAGSSASLTSLYEAALGPGVAMRHGGSDATAEGVRVMTHALLREPDHFMSADSERHRHWERQSQRLSALADLNASHEQTPEITNDIEAEQPVQVQRVWGAEIVLSVGASGMVMTHTGQGDFDRFRDAYILAMMQDVLLADVANAVFDATVPSSRKDGALAELLEDGPEIKAHQNMHWGGLITTDHSVQRFYELVVRQIRLDSRLEHTTRILAQAHATVAREANNIVEQLLTFVAILSFTVPLGLAVAQFQKPWPWDFLVVAGIIFGAVVSVALLRIATGRWWFRLSRRTGRKRKSRG